MTRMPRPRGRRRTRAAGPSTRGSAAPATPSAHRSAAVRAEILTQAGAGNATAGQQEVENHIASTLLGKSARVAHGSAPVVLLLERVFGARPEPGALTHQVVRDEELLRVADVHPVSDEAVAVHRLASVEPDDEVARRVR